MNQYKLRKDVDKLRYDADTTQSELNMLKATSVNGQDYYTKEDVDKRLQSLIAKSHGLPYFYKNDDGDLIMDVPDGVTPYFELDNEDNLIVTLGSGETNHYYINDDGDLIYDTEYNGGE